MITKGEDRAAGLGERGMENLIYASGVWARASGGTTWSYPGLECFAVTAPRRGFNQAIITSASVRNEDIRDAIARYRGLGLRCRFRMRDVLDAEMRPRLESLGMEHRGGIPAMALSGEMPAGPPALLTVEQVTDSRGLDATVAVVAEAFEWEADELAQVFRQPLIADPAWLGWVGYVYGEPVAASQAVIHNGVAGLYYVATRESHRRRGHGEALTRAAVDAVRARGCRLVTLNASPSGFPVYERLGFEHVGEHTGCVPPD